MERIRKPQFAVILWMLGFFGSMTIQSIFQAWFAEVTFWGRNVGWQTEIANWNLGLICILIPVQKSAEWSRKVIPGLCVLSLIFGLNRLQAFLRAETFKVGNLIGATLNLIAVVFGAWIYFSKGMDEIGAKS